MSSSTSGEAGSPWGRLVSTGRPQRWQWVSSRRTLALTLSRLLPLVRRGLVATVVASLTLGFE